MPETQRRGSHRDSPRAPFAGWEDPGEMLHCSGAKASPMSEPITSPHNRWVKRFRQAIDRHDDEIVVEGPKAVGDAVAAGWQPIAVIANESDDHDLEGLQPLRVTRALFDTLSDTVTAQGVVGLFARPRRSLESVLTDPRGLTVALDGVQDPGNVGTIVRLAAAFEATGVVMLPGCADPLSPKAIRSSAGAAIQVPVCRATARELLDAAAKHGIAVFATMAGADPSQTIPPRAVIVFGSEGRGVSAAIAAAAQPLSIAMSSSVESLNVAAAAAILLSRAWEQRR